ncbi:hypothetical protein BDR06DRAFT_1003406 [Suillus hirtellus]|nr:hypothetical protein BDR06DRAFT_1003406 [Suillus hirtellus]
MEDGMSFAECVDPVPLLFFKSSPQLFQLMIPYMSKRGAVMSGGEGTLEVLQRDVAATQEAPKISSGLFGKGRTLCEEYAAWMSRLLGPSVDATTGQ